MIDARFLNAYSALLELVVKATKKDVVRAIVKAWEHCEREGHINGFHASPEVRSQVMAVVRAINLHHPKRGDRKELKKDVSTGLHTRATHKLKLLKKLKRKRRRS